jgi:hypothetical protein
VTPKFAFSLLLTCTISLTSLQFARAAATVGDITAQIQKANILDRGAPFNVSVEGDKIRITTFRDSRENEKDRKINAVLLAKAAMEAAGPDSSISRVTVYFYGRDLSNYWEVSVSAGDVKAFAAGQTSQDQLLSAMSMEFKKQDSVSDRIQRQLESAAYARPDYKVAMKSSDQLVVTTGLADWVPDDEAMMEAVRLANNATTLAPGVREIKISFVDPRGKAPNREIAFDAANAKSIWERMQSDMASLRISKVQATTELGSEVAAGPLKQEREQLLHRLKELEKNGVGIAAFTAAFATVEAQVGAGDEAALKKGVDRLSASLDDAEKSLKAAKEAHPQGATVSLPKSAPRQITGRINDPGSRWGYGPTPITADEALMRTDILLARKKIELGPNPYKNPLFLKTLERIASVLNANGFASEGAQFQQRANEMRRAGVK